MIREKIVEIFNEAIEMRGAEFKGTLTDESVLLETGLDSLGFAILVARLEEELGYDPFVLMDTPVYPKRFSEFVGIYEQFKHMAN